ncbi:MAG TPA: ATP-binding protein [Candidatus Angelobacter sp.]|jgi:signal transduction histidine kinase|nr:ATP-binding protein [Candidatus Angelobacter sp.]
MRRSAWIFLAGILLPSLALAWLALRSARDQQVVLEHQQAVISQGVTDILAKKTQDQLDDARSSFVQVTQQLLKKDSSQTGLTRGFNRQLKENWKLAELGFVVDLRGMIYSPTLNEGAIAKTFRNENDRFLTNRENVEVFAQAAVNQQSLPKLNPPNQSQAVQTSNNNALPAHQLSHNESQSAANSVPNVNRNAQLPAQTTQNVAPSAQSDVGQSANQAVKSSFPQSQQAIQNIGQAGQATQMAQAERQVVPQQNFGSKMAKISNTVPEESDFRKVIGDQTSGALARFLQDKLRLMVWYRPPNSRSLVFGAQVTQPEFIQSLQPLLQSPELYRNTASGVTDDSSCLAILDDRGKPVALSRSSCKADWKHPFVATEIGEALPHWEAALYLKDPEQIGRSASTLRLTLGLIVAVLIAAILLGGWMMAETARRQMRMAQQKTDFVSNVSHELKTPLTSIRMFADMLAEQRVTDPNRQANYLRIISAESARLTRLINNVLDFARMERGAPSGERRACDLVEITREVVDTCRPHLNSLNIALALEVEAEALPVTGDRDALGQIVLNLLSNAEKYGGREILVRVRHCDGAVCVDVLDRGPGIPPKKLEEIFEPFRRLDDSLTSGVSGSGLGLTLARRMAKDHGGNVIYSPRDGGGSCFTLSMPVG